MSKRNKKNGLWFPDTYLEYIKGYSPLHKAVRDGLEGLQKEIDTVTYSLFPMVDVPVEDRPGYITHEHNYFDIKLPKNDELKSSLKEYFLSKYSKISRNLYGGRHNFAGLLNGAIQDLFVYGRIHYVIEWGEIELNGKNYILPVSFDQLDTVTTRQRIFGGYIQKYSLYTYFFGLHFKPMYGDKRKYKRSYKFSEEDILSFRYPFGHKSPVKRTHKSVAKLRHFWQFGLDQQRTTLEPNNHSFPLEYVRHTIFNREKRKYSLLKSKVKNTFHNVVDTGVKITSFYDIYTVTEHKKKLNDLRNYLVKEFNHQIMTRIAKKNNLEYIPEIYFNYFLTNKQLDGFFQDFSNHKITIEEYIKKVLKKD